MERPVELQQRVFKRFFETAEVAGFSPEQRNQYEESLKVYRDWNNVIETKERKSWNEGRDLGRAEGERKGRAEGKAEGLKEVAAKMKQANMPVEQIQTLTGLSVDEITAL